MAAASIPARILRTVIKKTILAVGLEFYGDTTKTVNKVKEKRGVLPDGVQYFAGDDVPDFWNCYPWDAADYNQTIGDHEELAKIVQCGRLKHI